MSTWNKKNFSIYTSDERSALGLIEELGSQTNYNTQELEKVKESDNKKVSHDEMNEIYKIDKNADFTGSWHGIKKPTASQEGLQATVDKIVEEDIPNINSQLDTIIIRGETADDINNALELTQQKRIYNVFLPNREEPYLIDKEIMLKSNIRFYSNGATLKPSGKLLTVDACPIIRNYNFGASVYNGDYNITIEGFNIDCNNSKVSGISLAHTNNCKIINNKIMNTLAPSHGMDLVCNKDLTVEHNYLQNCPQGGIQIDGSLEGSLPTLTTPNLFVDNIGSKNINIVNNRFYNCLSGAIHFHKTRHENILIDNNIFEQCDGCIIDDDNYNSSHQYISIMNNDFLNSPNMSCIVLKAGHNKLKINNNNFYNVKNAIILDKNLNNNNKYNDLKIQDNNFDMVLKSTIQINNGNRCVINGNSIKEYGSSDGITYKAIYLLDSNYIDISNNDIYNIVGDTTNRIAVSNNVNCSNINIFNNNIVGCVNAWRGDTNTQYVDITGNTIRNCDAQALLCESFTTILKNYTIQDNIIDTVRDNAIRIANAQGIVISGNIIREYPADKRAISLNTTSFSNISNNHITGVNYGISISAKGNGVTTGLNIINGNVLNGNTIELLNDSQDNIISNNIIKGKTLNVNTTNNTVVNNRVVS